MGRVWRLGMEGRRMRAAEQVWMKQSLNEEERKMKMKMRREEDKEKEEERRRKRMMENREMEIVSEEREWERV